MNVPTRWSPSTPSERSAFASRAVRSPRAAYVRRLGGASPAHVTTSLPANAVVPKRMIDVTVSGMSIIVLSTAVPPRQVPDGDSATRDRQHVTLQLRGLSPPTPAPAPEDSVVL